MREILSREYFYPKKIFNTHCEWHFLINHIQNNGCNIMIRPLFFFGDFTAEIRSKSRFKSVGNNLTY